MNDSKGTTCEYPGFFARFYDLIYHKVRSSTDHEYFLGKIRNTPGRVLEIGVGTGRFFTEALNLGSDIYGIDISPAMIEVLKRKLPQEQHHRVSIQDIRDFRFDKPFDLILAPFRVMMHLTEKQDQLRALETVFRHLNPGGTFIFDAFIPDLNQLLKGWDHFPDFDEEYEPGRRVRRIVTTHPDLISQQIEVEFAFEWNDENGDHRESWTTSLRFFFRFELEHLLERSPFEAYDIYGDYKEGALNKDSKEFIVCCRKR